MCELSDQREVMKMNKMDRKIEEISRGFDSIISSCERIVGYIFCFFLVACIVIAANFWGPMM